MQRYSKGEQIGTGAHKDVFDAKENKNLVVAEYQNSEKLTDNQIKSAYYLNKIGHIFFPKNIQDIEAAFNYPPDTKSPIKGQLTGPSTLYINKGYRDVNHDIDSRLLVELTRQNLKMNQFTAIDIKEASEHFRQNKQDPKIIQFIKTAKEHGIFVDNGGQNFSRDPEGDIVYLETNPAWEIKEDGHIFYYAVPGKIRDAIINLKDPAQRERAIKYYERLIALMPK